MTELIILIEVTLVWIGLVAFVVIYGFWSEWRSTLPGRVIMHFGQAFLALVTYALILRAVEPPAWIHDILAVTIYGAIAISVWRLTFVVRAAQLGKVSIDTPNYTPIRDRIRARKQRNAKRKVR